jgi:hypothetical protein
VDWVWEVESILPGDVCVFATWVSTGGAASVIREVRISSATGVDATTLRGVTSDWLRRSASVAWDAVLAEDPSLEDEASGLWHGFARGGRGRGRPRGPSDENVVVVAALYLRALGDDPRDPWGSMRKLASTDPAVPEWLRVSLRSDQQRFVRIAVKRGILTKPERRKASAEWAAEWTPHGRALAESIGIDPI